jgi:hypothetical protein
MTSDSRHSVIVRFIQTYINATKVKIQYNKLPNPLDYNPPACLSVRMRMQSHQCHQNFLFLRPSLLLNAIIIFYNTINHWVIELKRI